MGSLRVFIDSSRKGNGKCQAGAIYHSPIDNKQIEFSSEIFEAENNNSAEIYGIYLVLKAIYEKYNITNFKVFNDNIISMAMLKSGKKITKKTLKKHKVLAFVLEYFKEHNIVIMTEQVNRTHKMMKRVDKLSKKFRKEKV